MLFLFVISRYYNNIFRVLKIILDDFFHYRKTGERMRPPRLNSEYDNWCYDYGFIELIKDCYKYDNNDYQFFSRLLREIMKDFFEKKT